MLTFLESRKEAGTFGHNVIHLFEHPGLASTVLPTDAGHEEQARVLMLSAVCRHHYPWNPVVAALQRWVPFTFFAIPVPIHITFLDHFTQNCTLQTHTYNTHMHTQTRVHIHPHTHTCTHMHTRVCVPTETLTHTPSFFCLTYHVYHFLMS